MAQIDVSELMSDPDFVDPIQVITRVPTVNSRGENSFSTATLTTVGCVQPAPNEKVDKLPEAFRTANVKSFWFKGTIVTSAVGKYSDILVFKTKRYQVIDVADWSNFGSGYTEGLCVAEVPAP